MLQTLSNYSFLIAFVVLAVMAVLAVKSVDREKLFQRARAFAWVGLSLAAFYGVLPTIRIHAFHVEEMWAGGDYMPYVQNTVIQGMYVLLPLVCFVAYLKNVRWFKPVAIGCMSMMVLFHVEFSIVNLDKFLTVPLFDSLLSDTFWYIACECVAVIPPIVCRNRQVC